MTEIELYSAALCPYAQRVRLALSEKGIVAKEIEIDPRNKPAGFSDISPHGKVPLLRHGGRSVWESAVINEYIEDAFAARPLLPRDPGQRARARIWVAFADARIYGPTEAMMHSREPELCARTCLQLADNLRFLDARGLSLGESDGPYLLGRDASLADIALHPWFEQVGVLERFLGFRMPQECARLARWAEAMAARPAVRALAPPPGFYVERYGKLLQQLEKARA